MPKLKIRKSITRRFKVTKTGKVMRRHGFRRHLNVKKTAKRRRRLSKVVEAKKIFSKKIKKALGM